MAETKELIIAIVGYVIAFVSPILGLIAGAVIFFTQKENPFLNRHGKYIMVFAVIMWIISIILVMTGAFPSIV